MAKHTYRVNDRLSVKYLPELNEIHAFVDNKDVAKLKARAIDPEGGRGETIRTMDDFIALSTDLYAGDLTLEDQLLVHYTTLKNWVESGYVEGVIDSVLYYKLMFALGKKPGFSKKCRYEAEP